MVDKSTADTSTTGIDPNAAPAEGAAPGATEPVEPRENARLSAMDEIAARNDAQIEQQLADQGLSSGPKSVTQQTQPPAQPAGAEPVEAAPKQPEPDQITLQIGSDPVPIERLDGVKVRIKIDGKVREMTINEMRREAQLDGAARDRFREATELLEQVRSSAQPAAAAATPPVGDDKKTPGNESADVAATAQRLVQALFDGDEDKATQVMQEALAGRSQPATPTMDSLIPQLVPAVKQQLSEERALEQFAADYKEIVADPHLADLADRHLAAVLQEEPHKPYAEALQEAGDRTRDWMKRVGLQSATEPATTIRDRKLETRKQQIDNVSGLSTKATTVEEPTPTASSVIAEMRAARLAA